ncbi:MULTISPECIES: hypothetical protein [unclassified Lysinibacillus]|uniref:hypothetical protein n=1 Tax=unclassified Lysinibacillus TaxID=2636778 RepID=UPI0036EF1254
MNEKSVSLILVAISSLLALYFGVTGNFQVAVLFLTIMFTLTNFFRYRSFKQQGLEKESKWMRSMAMFFAIATLIVLYIIITG